MPTLCIHGLQAEGKDGGSSGVVESMTKKRDRQSKGNFLFAAAGGSVTLQPKVWNLGQDYSGNRFAERVLLGLGKDCRVEINLGYTLG